MLLLKVMEDFNPGRLMEISNSLVFSRGNSEKITFFFSSFPVVAYAAVLCVVTQRRALLDGEKNGYSGETPLVSRFSETQAGNPNASN